MRSSSLSRASRVARRSSMLVFMSKRPASITWGRGRQGRGLANQWGRGGRGAGAGLRDNQVIRLLGNPQPYKASVKPTTLQGFCETHNPNKSKPGGEEEEEAGRRRRRSGAEKKKMKRDGEEEEEEEEEEAGGKEEAGPWF